MRFLYLLVIKLDFKKLINSINSKVSLVVFANPNSPTGTILNHKQIIDILTKAYAKGVMVLIDEAYFGFSKYTALPLLKRFSNLIIATEYLLFIFRSFDASTKASRINLLVGSGTIFIVC